MQIDNLDNSVVGMVGFTGRSGVEEFAQKVLPFKARVKRATKLEDMIPMLSLGISKTILITERHLEYLQSVSRQPFTTKPLPEARMGILALFIRRDADKSKFEGAAEGLLQECRKLARVDTWQ